MTMQNITAAPPVTLEAYATLPKHPRHELVQGVLTQLMPASRAHEMTGSLVNWRLSEYVFPGQLGEVYGSNRGYVTVPGAPATSRMPDVSFVSNARLGQPDLAGTLYDGAPDLAVGDPFRQQFSGGHRPENPRIPQRRRQRSLGDRHRRPDPRRATRPTRRRLLLTDADSVPRRAITCPASPAPSPTC